MIDDVGSLPRLHSLTRPVRAFKGVNGYRAAATLLPSSCSKLNVELALRWAHVERQCVMPFQLPVCSAHTESNTSTWIPRELRCFLNAGGGNRPRLPVPTKRISVIMSARVSRADASKSLSSECRTWSRHHSLKNLELVLTPSFPRHILLVRRANVPQEHGSFDDNDR